MDLLDIFEYVTYTPNNTNPAILKEMLKIYGAEDNFEQVYEYVLKNPHSLNLAIFEKIVEEEGGDTPSEGSSIVGTMKVGSGIVGEEEK